MCRIPHNGGCLSQHSPLDSSYIVCLMRGMCVFAVCVCVWVCGCVCNAQSFQQIHGVRYNTPPLNSNVRTAAMFGCSTPCGLSSLSARHTGYIQTFMRLPLHAAPHAHAPTLMQGPRLGELATAHVVVCVCVCVRVMPNLFQRELQCPLSYNTSTALSTCMCVCVCVCGGGGYHFMAFAWLVGISKEREESQEEEKKREG